MDARPRTAAHWEAMIDSALHTPSGDSPSLARALSRLLYLDEAMVSQAEWDELHWLIAEVRHFQQRRAAKHPLTKWKPRAAFLTRINHFLLRGAVKHAAILGALERWALELRGQGCTDEPSMPMVDPLQLSRLVHAAQELGRQVDNPPETSAIAEFLVLQITLFEALLREWCPEEVEPETAGAWPHFVWHCREAAGTPLTWRMERLSRSLPHAHWTVIALEEGEKLLHILHHALRRTALGAASVAGVSEIC